MRIVIDLQAAQSSGSHNRGIGRYSLSLALAIVRNCGEHEVFIALNGLFPESIESIRKAFNGLLPEENIRVWEALGGVSASDASNDIRRKSMELMREVFLASLKPDFVLLSSLFEGFVDDAITSIGRFSSGIPTAVTLYDLIPYIRPKPYLENPVVEKWYRGKIEDIRRANLWLAISDSSRREGVEFLGLPEESVINISSDADAHFKVLDITPPEEQNLRLKYGLCHPFVMYTGGIDYRKNIEGLIRAYAKLPSQLRRNHQLAIVCSVQPEQKMLLERLARKEGLDEGELILTGFVPEEDLLALYNLCALFVFPSLHEGFGLPVLEAMRCGAPVIGARASSIPEVIGWEEALFDPNSDEEMADTIKRGLTDENYRVQLIQHCKTYAQNFSWDESARRAVAAMERFNSNQRALNVKDIRSSSEPKRPKLAYISPLPPERSGIADYSAELLPVLSCFYNIEVIVDQADVTDSWVKEHCPIRSLDWFFKNAHSYDRVMYHFGNSHFHQHMFPLLESLPGVVVLHDFFLSGIQAHREMTVAAPNAWAQALYASHGYHAVLERYTAADIADVIWRYPANLPVLQRALGVIVHGEYSRKLARQWYGPDAASDWNVIPLLRVPAESVSRAEIRRELGFGSDDLVICSFGLLGPTKLNHRLLQAFLASPLAGNPKAYLVFVGENHNGDYGEALLRAIEGSGCSERIRITGWADTATFRAYLAGSDIAVQLRALSRGETSGTVLDCMNYALPTIVNAHGSMADLDADGVWMLPDEFSDQSLSDALTTLTKDHEYRQNLGAQARDILRTKHDPQLCAQLYFEAIEAAYLRAQNCVPGLLAELADLHLPDEMFVPLALSLASNFPSSPRRRQWLVDVSGFKQGDIPGFLKQWLYNPPDGYQVEPVYAVKDGDGYLYARRYTSNFLGVSDRWTQDEPAEAWQGDVFIYPDGAGNLFQSPFLRRWRDLGVKFATYTEAVTSV